MDETNKENTSLVVYREDEQIKDQLLDEAKELSISIAKSQDRTQLDSLYNKFKINDTKQNVFRVNKLNELLDNVIEEASERFKKRPGEMSNKEVIDYMNAVQGQIDKAKSTADSVKDIQAIQVNTTNNINVNVNQETLSRESRERILDFISDIIKESQEDSKLDEHNTIEAEFNVKKDNTPLSDETSEKPKVDTESDEFEGDN